MKKEKQAKPDSTLTRDKDLNCNMKARSESVNM